jgi:aspartate kinase
MKFGGTSVQDAPALRRLVTAVASEPRRRIVVVSALAGVTDTLCDLLDGKVRDIEVGEVVHRLLERHLALVRELVAAQVQRELMRNLRECFEETVPLVRSRSVLSLAGRDAVLAVGELASSNLVAAVLSAAGVPAIWVDARRVVSTDDNFGHARPQDDGIRGSVERQLVPYFEGGHVPVLGGFIGSTAEGVTTTLGRGGSDYSAALLGAASGADEIQIWTDVDGVLTSDPRVVARTALIDRLSFHEAYELARFGAKVLHWGTLEPAAAHDIPVRVLNSKRDGTAGTMISARRDRKGVAYSPTVAGLAHQPGLTVADVRPRGVTGSVQFLQEALEWLAAEGQGVTVITLSAIRLVMASTKEDAIDRFLAALDRLADARVIRNAATVTAVGDGVTGHAAVWSALAAARYAGHVELIVPADSGNALVCVTSRTLAPRLLSHLHDSFWPSGATPATRTGATAGTVL